jgi:hypothetical protein
MKCLRKLSVVVLSIILCLGIALPCLNMAVAAVPTDIAPTVTLFDPVVDGFVVQVNGYVDWGTYDPNKILWDWADQTPIVWAEGYFVNSHEYSALGEYIISVKAQFGSEQDPQYSEIAQVIVNVDGSESGGYYFTIDNSNGGGSVFYRTSLNPQGDTVSFGDSNTLYLAPGDIVWGITATPDEGYLFGHWHVDQSTIRDGYGFNEMTSPIDVIASYDEQYIAPIFKEITIISVSCDPTSLDKTNPSQSPIEISGSLTNYFGDQISEMNVELYYEGLTTHVQGVIGSITTDGNGEFSYSWTPNPDLPNDEYRLTAFMVGDDYYAPSFATTGMNGISNLFVVPEYFIGGLAALGACFAGLVFFKKRDSILNFRHH